MTLKCSVVAIQKISSFIFHLLGLLLASYFIAKQIIQYYKNDDKSTVSMRRYHTTPEDKYPTFSICLFGTKAKIFRFGNLQNGKDMACADPCKDSTYKKDNRKECSKRCSPLEYYEMVAGKKEDGFNMTTITFEDKANDIISNVREFYTSLKNGTKIRKIGVFGLSTKNPTLTTSYQDANHICVTKEDIPGRGYLSKQDYLELDASPFLLSSNPDIHIFVHQKGQLLSALEQPHVVLENRILVDAKNKNDYGFSYEINLRINTVEVLKKRPDAVNSCDETLKDEDNFWINKAIKIIGCTPTFLKRFRWNSTLSGQTDTPLDCKKDHYYLYKNQYGAKYHFDNVSKLYVPPCTQMTSIVSSVHSITPAKFTFGTPTKSVKIRIEYAMNGFKQATNHRAFGVLSLWSQIGGFVGILLGYSLLQLPSLMWVNMTETWKRFKNDKKKKGKGNAGKKQKNDSLRNKYIKKYVHQVVI